jgi:hypothetical protein
MKVKYKRLDNNLKGNNVNNLKEKVQALLVATPHGVINDFFQSEISEKTNWDDKETTQSRAEFAEEGITFKHEDNFGGEGMGDEYWSVYSFTDKTDKVYVQFNGWYQSYNGSEFTEFFFVEPKEVKVIQYFKV